MKLLTSASSTTSSTKIKTLIHSVIIPHMIRALSKAKTVLVQILKKKRPIVQLIYPHQKNNYRNNKMFFGSFRMHYNWCSSSHVMPVPAPELLYYDSSWSSIISTADEDSQLSGYLQWLEEKNEIDKLADMFIADCHEKFRLEKVESYRRFQEMLARSV